MRTKDGPQAPFWRGAEVGVRRLTPDHTQHSDSGGNGTGRAGLGRPDFVVCGLDSNAAFQTDRGVPQAGLTATMPRLPPPQSGDRDASPGAQLGS